MKNIIYSNHKNHYKFYFNNKKDNNILLYVLCGYKSFLYEKIFSRLKRCVKKDYDICLVTCGIYSEEIYNLAKENGWCYLYSSLNNVSFGQNVVIELFSKANLIIKMDEDIFLTDGTFEKLISTYNYLKDKEKIGYIAPLINVNGYGTTKLLEILNYKDSFENRFGKIKIHYGGLTKTLKNIDLIKALWNIDDSFLSIDECNSLLKNNINQYAVCKIGFSIGLILFDRDFWLKINKFKTKAKNKRLGLDEMYINRYARLTKYKKIICLSSLVGHFSFRNTSKEMKEVYLKHKNKF